MLITAAIGLVAGAIIGGVVASANGQDWKKGALIGAAIGGLVGLGAGAAAGVLLAGSVTAATASVISGGSALATTVGGGGLVAGGKFIMDNVSRAANIGGTQVAAQATSNTYYQVTSNRAAQTIINTNTLIPGEFNRVFVTRIQPTLSQASTLGAQSMETVIRFQTNYGRFVQDPSFSIRNYLMANTTGAIEVFNVVKVGFKK